MTLSATHLPHLAGANISECGRYRYALWRGWGDGPLCVFVMLNPSTADGETDDNTIRRCLGFAKGFGCGRLAVVNLYAFRATDPDELLVVDDPVGSANDESILEWTDPDELLTADDPVGPRNGESTLKWTVQQAPLPLVIAAWGAHEMTLHRAGHVRHLLARHQVEVFHLGLTKNGYPKHPLRLRKDTPLTPWPYAWKSA